MTTFDSLDRSSSGFTLIEVLIALSIVGVVVPAIGLLVSINICTTQSAIEKVSLANTARTILTEALRRRYDVVEERTGEFSGYRWRLDSRALDASGEVLPVAAGKWEPRKMTLSVQSPAGQSIKIETIQLVRKSHAG